MLSAAVIMGVVVFVLWILPLLSLAFESEVYENVHNIRVDQIEGTEAIFDNFTDAVEYKGVWNASTNTPTLVDGTGGTGDFYVVSTGGTQDLGSGSLTYTTGDWVICNGTIWQKGDMSVTASEIPIADAGVIITATNVEDALQENRTAIDLNTTHSSSDGSDHTFIDQSVVSGGSPTFTGANFTAMDANDVNIADVGVIITATEVEGALQENRTAIDLNTTHRGSDGSDHTFIDQSVVSGGSPTFTGANFTAIDANDVNIADVGVIITATEVEGALQENRTAIDLNTTHAGSDGSDHTFIDQDVTIGAAPTLAATNLTGTFSGSLAEDSDGMFSPDFLSGAGTGAITGPNAESGIWIGSCASGLPEVARISDINTTQYYDIPLDLKAKTTALKGVKITSVKVAYDVTLADDGDDVACFLCKRTMPADNAAPGAITVIVGDVDGDYDGDHNTAAKRSNSAGGHQDNTMVITNDTEAYIADGETWFLRFKVNEANDATLNLAVILKDVNVYFKATIA